MTTYARLLLGVLGLCAVVLPVGCSLFGSDPNTLDALRSYIADEVDDPLRASAMQAQVDRAEAHLNEFQQALGDLGIEMRATNADYDASREQIDELFQRHNGMRSRVQEQVLGSLLAMRDLATEDEWGDLFDISIDAFRRQLRQGGLTSSVSATEEQDG